MSDATVAASVGSEAEQPKLERSLWASVRRRSGWFTDTIQTSVRGAGNHERASPQGPQHVEQRDVEQTVREE